MRLVFFSLSGDSMAKYDENIPFWRDRAFSFSETSSSNQSSDYTMNLLFKLKLVTFQGVNARSSIRKKKKNKNAVFFFYFSRMIQITILIRTFSHSRNNFQSSVCEKFRANDVRQCLSEIDGRKLNLPLGPVTLYVTSRINRLFSNYLQRYVRAREWGRLKGWRVERVGLVINPPI